MNKISKKEKVDWKKFIELEDNYDSEFDYLGKAYNDMVDELLEKGVLSLNPEGNYQLIGAGVLVSPRQYGMCRLYFTQRCDAEKYARLNYSNAMYEVTIDKIEKEFVPKRLK